MIQNLKKLKILKRIHVLNLIELFLKKLVFAEVIYYSEKGDEYNERHLYSELKRVK